MKIFTVFFISLFLCTTYLYTQANEIQNTYAEVLFLTADNLSFNQGYQNLKDNPAPIFYLDNASPGEEVTKYLKVQNNGKLDIKYKINFEITQTSMIEDIIIIDIKQMNEESESFLAKDLPLKVLTSLLKSDSSVIYQITIKINQDAGNEYNNLAGVFKFTINCSYEKGIEIEEIALCSQYFGSLHNRNWVKVGKVCGLAEMKFPKIYSGNGWSVINGKLQYEGLDVEGNDIFKAPIGIKVLELLNDYKGYQLTSVTVNGEDYQLVESIDDWDLKKGLTHQVYLQIGRKINNENNLNSYRLEEITHEIRIKLASNNKIIILKLSVSVGENGK